MHIPPKLAIQHLGPRDLALIRKVFETACAKTRIPHLSKRAVRLASFIADEYRLGNKDETSLLECAIWFGTARIPLATEDKSPSDTQVAATREGRGRAGLRKTGVPKSQG